MRLGNGLVEKLGKNELARSVEFVDNGDCICLNTDNCICEDTLGSIEKTLGSVPSFMRLLPEEALIRDWPLWKIVGEIDIERAAYLLSTDRLLEELL